MNGIKIAVFFVLFVFASRAQSDSALTRHVSGSMLKKLGKNALLQNDPASAVTFFKAYLKTNPNDAVAMENLGKAYMLVRDYEKSQRAFLSAYKINKAKVPEALYYHARMLKSNEKYDSARINFQKFKQEYKGPDKVLKKQATREIVFCDSVQNLLKAETKIVIQHLDSSINKINTEAAPFNVDDNTLLFTSLRTDKKEYIADDDSMSGPKKKLYYATRSNGQWTFKGEYGQDLNDPAYNISNACFSADRKRLYFTRCKLNYKEEMICAIYMAEKNGNEWGEPVKLPKPVNSNKYTSTMPALGIDPVKGNDVIYFVSDRKGGKGGMDIWYTIYDKKNKIFKTPKNAGSKINTTQNEISPFADLETKSLYFSSDGMGGLGGYDVFRAVGDGKKWSQVDNIGQPINTGADDIYYTISTNRQEGFFVSNRKGGNALKNATCCDDIYYYKQSRYIQINLRGNVNDIIEHGVVIPQATIEVYIKNRVTDEKTLVKTIQSDSVGAYFTSLEPSQDYFLVVKKTDYLGGSEEVTTRGIAVSRDIEKDMGLMKRPKEAVHIPEVTYDFDRSNVSEGGKRMLDSTVLKLMILNPELVVEIQAHTDGKGSESYNKKLSQKRAESAVAYLISQKIDPKRLRAVGYGESRPIAPNENPDGSDNPEGRAKNRRTDFKIIGVIDAEIINDAKLEDD